MHQIEIKALRLIIKVSMKACKLIATKQFYALPVCNWNGHFQT
jgi:hypothetical protein